MAVGHRFPCTHIAIESRYELANSSACTSIPSYYDSQDTQIKASACMFIFAPSAAK